MSRFNNIYVFSIPLLLLLAWFVVSATGAPWSDFAGYYFGSRELLHGDYTKVYDTYSLNALIAEQGYTGIFVSYTPFPPFTALLFAPFLQFPPATAKVLFNIFSCLFFLITLYRSFRFLNLPAWIFLLIPLVFFVPVRNNIFLGQSYLLLTALLLEGYIAYKKGKHIAASLFWGIVIVFKVFPLLIILFLLVRKQFVPAVYCMVSCFLLLGLSVMWTGLEPWKFYVLDVMPRLSNGELNDPFTYLFQSAHMLLKNIFVYDKLMNPGVEYDSPYLFNFLLALFKAFIIAACIRVTIRKQEQDGVAFALWITASLMISPNGSSYSLVLLLLPLLTLYHEQGERKYLFFLAALLLLAVCNIPVHWFASYSTLFQYPRLYLMILFFVLLLVVVKIRPSIKVWMAIFILWFIADAIKYVPGRDKSTYLLSRDEHILIYDFEIRNGQLVYYYWDDAGGHAVTTGIEYAGATGQDVAIKDNQLYYKGRALTSSRDWKKKPLLVSGSHIIYLSDKNRGAGFYTLRKIALQ